MWHREQMILLDTETTAANPLEARIVTATVIPVIPGRTPEPVQWLIDPGVEIPDEAAKIHGITTEHARTHGRAPAEALPEITAELAAQLSHGVPLVAMNACYDLTVLDRDCRRHGVTTLTQWLGRDPAPVIDPMVLDRRVDRYRKGGRTLTHLCHHYKVALDGAHDSTADALAAGRVAWRIAETHPHIAHLPLEQLHRDQTAWRAEQCTSLADYFRRKGKTAEAANVRTEWPLIPYREEQVS